MLSKACGLLLSLTIASPSQTVFPSKLTRFAGSDTSNLIGDNGPAYYAVFRNAAGLARDAAGQFYIAESTRVRKIDTHGTVTTIASGLKRPTALALDATNHLYFIDDNRTIGRLAADGSITTIAGDGSSSYNGEGVAALSAGIAPNALAFDATGQLYFTDFVNARVRVIRADSKVYTVAGTSTAGHAGEGGPAAQAQLFQPFALAFDATGNLYVTDSMRITRIDPQGILTRVAGDPNLSPTSQPQEEVPATQTVVYGGFLALDAAGDIFVASPNVRKITPDGIIHEYAGLDAGTDPLGLHACGDAHNVIVIVKAMVGGADGNLYVLNAADNLAKPKLQSVTPAGKIATVAGDGPNLFSGDGGPAAEATFAAPSALVFDAKGTLFIADTANNRVRAIDAFGMVRTVAGDGGPNYDQDPACMADQNNYLRAPRALWVDTAGNLLVADTNKNRIRKVAPDGTQSTVADSLNQPVGVAADDAGNIFVAEAGARRVVKFDRQGNRTTVANVAPSGVLGFAKNGEMLIPTGAEVDRLTPDGTLLPAAGVAETDANNLNIAAINNAAAAITDAAGSLYVADSDKAVIQRTSINCAISADGRSQLNRPSALAFDSAGNLYIADSGAGAIWVALPKPPAVNELPTPFLALQRPVQNAAPSLLPPPPFQPDPFHPPPTSQEAIVPSELIRLNGACIGPADPVNAAFDPNGKLPTTLSDVSLLIHGAPVPLISVQQGSIVGVAPAVTLSPGGGTTTIQLGYKGQGVNSSVPAQAANPALFTVNLQANGTILAVNPDGSINSASHPAPKGGIVLLYGSGFGTTDPAIADGAAAPADPLARLTLPVTAIVGGLAADVLYAGAAPGFAGLTQINLRIPASLTGQGAAPIAMKAGGIPLNQNTVTIFVQ